MTGIASKSQLRMSFLRYALFSVPAMLLLGALSAALAGSSADNAWYMALNRPPLTPPGWVFGVVWTILYVLLGLVFAMLLHARGARKRGRLIALFVIGIILNLAWSPIFFRFHQVTAALVVIAAMIVPRAISLLREVFSVLAESAPKGMSVDDIRTHLKGYEGVVDVHDVHVWQLTRGAPVFTAHVSVAQSVYAQGRSAELLTRLQSCLADHFDVEHSTFQLEPAGHDDCEATHA